MDPLTIKSREALEQESSISLENVQTPSNETSNEKQEGSFLGEIFKFAILALVIVIPFRIFIAQPFIVSGASMSPTFHSGEYLIVDQITYRLEEPQRGDVVVFRFPNDPSKFFIKRIIGLPGEVVKLANGVTTIVDLTTNTETVLDEEYLITDKTDDHLSITLSPSEYFVMGDNRSASSDSRVWGPVPAENLVGRALLRLLPVNTFSLFPGAFHYSPEITLNSTNVE